MAIEEHRVQPRGDRPAHVRVDRVADHQGLRRLSEIERELKEPSSEVIGAVARALDLTLVDLTIAVTETLTASQRRAGRGPACRVKLALAA